MVLDQFLTVSIADFKQAGLFTPQVRQKALFEWRRGAEYASITAVTDGTAFVPFALLSYYHNGRPVEQGVTLRWHALYNGGGFYYFVCPVSGLSCEKLYFSEQYGQFIGRVATRAKYLHNLRGADRRAVEARPYRWQLLNRNPRAVTL